MSEQETVSNAPVSSLWGAVSPSTAGGPKGKTPVFHRKVHSIPVPKCGVRQPCITEPILYRETTSANENRLEDPQQDASFLPRDRNGANLILHCIDLQRYIAEVQSMTEAEKGVEGRSKGETNERVVPEIPQTHWPSPDQLRLPHIPSDEPQFQLPLSDFKEKEILDLLKKGVATQCIFTGYERAQNGALDILVDVAGQYLSKLCQVFHQNFEHKLSRRPLGFQDAMEQTLYQFNVSGHNELHQYWQSRVAMYASRLGSKARDVQAECHRVFEKVAFDKDKQNQTNIEKRKRRPLSSISGEPSLLLSDTTDTEVEEEIPLETILVRHQSPDIKSPDLISFTPLATEEHESFDFAMDAPLRKRMKSVSSTLPDRRLTE